MSSRISHRASAIFCFTDSADVVTSAESPSAGGEATAGVFDSVGASLLAFLPLPGGGGW